MLYIIIQKVSKLCEWEGVSPWVAIYLYVYINTDIFSQWLNNCDAALAAW